MTALRATGQAPMFDVAVVGAGPAGLAAAGDCRNESPRYYGILHNDLDLERHCFCTRDYVLAAIADKYLSIKNPVCLTE